MTIRKGKKSLKQQRHLLWEVFSKRLAKGIPFVEVISGSPKVVFFCEAGASRLGIRFWSKNSQPVVNTLAEIEVEERRIGRDTVMELRTSNAQLYQSFYHFCCTAADAVQLDEQDVSEAIAKTLSAWASLVRRRLLLTSESQVGLYGELVFLNACADRNGWKSASESWLGPYGEEHDFSLARADVDVKCTTAERRTHWISSLTQLLPKVGRRLFVVSVQLTAASSRNAMSLPQMVAATLSSATSESKDAGLAIRAALDRAGWVDEDVDLYPVRYELRSDVMVVPIDSRFPSITPSTLTALGPHRLPRIAELHYRVDVEGLGHTLASPFAGRHLFAGTR